MHIIDQLGLSFFWGGGSIMKIHLHKIVFLSCLFLLIFGVIQPLGFLATADPHAGAEWAPKKAKEQVSVMQALINDPASDIKAILFPGDLTHRAYTGLDVKLSKLKYLIPIPFIKRFFPNYPPPEEVVNELRLLRKEWINPLTDGITCKKKPKIYICPGNHDIAFKSRNFYHTLLRQSNVIKAIQNQSPNRKTYYHFKHDPVHFFCCAIYPDETISKWFERKLETLKISNDEPIVIYFHYHVASTWWNQEDKDRFYEIIKNLNAFVITGHKHKTYSTLWNNKIPMINVSSGKKFAQCTYIEEQNKFETLFFDKDGKAYSWNEEYIYLEEA